MPEFCEQCGSLKIQGICTNRRLHDPDFRSHLWLIDGQEYRFRVALTRIEAEQVVRGQSDLLLKPAKEMKRRIQRV